MKGPGSFPPAFKLLAVRHVLSNAFQKIIPDGPALCFFPKLGLNTVVPFPGDSVQLGEARQVRHRFDPEQHFVFRNRILIRECRVDFGSIVHGVFRLGNAVHKNETPSGNQLGVTRQPVKLNTIMKTYQAEVKVT